MNEQMNLGDFNNTPFFTRTRLLKIKFYEIY